MAIRLMTIAGLLLVGWLGSSCTAEPGFDAQLGSIVKPYRFSIARWELTAIPAEVNQWVFSGYQQSDGEIAVVAEYFSLMTRIKTLKSAIQSIEAGNRQGDSAALAGELDGLQQQRVALENRVEQIIEGQIREALVEQGIFNPIDNYLKLPASFPPVNFTLEEPPYLLVISPRERIESQREILLQAGLSRQQMEDIEAEADELGVSSLVVKLGGLGATYPTFVTNEASLRFTIDTATEEWLHQYLAFKPLGFLYLLDLTGVSRNYEIATINETLAGMVSQEIGTIVYQKYYADTEYQNDSNRNQPAAPAFDFDREMREIRIAVDSYLLQGEIEQAEEFMEQKRQYLAAMGRYIRKLNQAYFAFYGTYANRPTSVSPIGLELKELRNQSASLQDFLNTAAAISSRQQLRDSIK